MGMTDQIADMLTRIRNANKAHFKAVEVLPSKMNQNIARVLKKSGYISGFELKKGSEGRLALKIYLKYADSRTTVIAAINRVSKPGRRVYAKSTALPKVLNGYGVSIISTSRGVLTDSEARQMNVGGEIICNVW